MFKPKTAEELLNKTLKDIKKGIEKWKTYIRSLKSDAEDIGYRKLDQLRVIQEAEADIQDAKNKISLLDDEGRTVLDKIQDANGEIIKIIDRLIERLEE